jgi:hypothetical protein
MLNIIIQNISIMCHNKHFIMYRLTIKLTEEQL